MAPDEAADLGRRIEEAKLVLLDPVARAGYDARLSSGTPLPHTGHTDDSTPTVAATAPPEFGVPATMAVPEPERQAEPAPPPVQPAPVLAPVPAPPVLVPAAVPVATPIPSAALVAPAPSVPVAQAPAEAPARAVANAAFPEPAQWTGEFLRRAREARGLTMVQLAERTRITRHHLMNVEADAYGSLPAGVYLRGIIMSMARELRLDGQKVARSYLDAMTAAAAKNPTP
jgi:hypothetical protein